MSPNDEGPFDKLRAGYGIPGFPAQSRFWTGDTRDYSIPTHRTMKLCDEWGTAFLAPTSGRRFLGRSEFFVSHVSNDEGFFDKLRADYGAPGTRLFFLASGHSENVAGA